MNKILMIGGSGDGARIYCNHQVLRYPIQDEINNCVPPRGPVPKPDFKYDTYHRQYYRDMRGNEYVLYVCEDFDAMEELIKKYR